MSGDVNPAHIDAAFAAQDMFGHVVVQGMWTAGLMSALLGTKLPGPGTIYLDQNLQFRHPVIPGDVITTTATVKEKRVDKRIVLLDTRVHQPERRIGADSARHRHCAGRADCLAAHAAPGRRGAPA